MSVVLIDKLLDSFISDFEIKEMTENVKNALAIIENKETENPKILSEIAAIKAELRKTDSESKKAELKEKIKALQDIYAPIGWLKLPFDYDREEFERIKTAAKKIRGMCDVFIVLGIGGSYLGARAAIEFIKTPNYNLIKGNKPQIFFAGNSISASSINELIAICEGKDICINVISKSGETTETAVAFRIFRELMENKYGVEEARKRIFVTTGDDPTKTLKKLSFEMSYETFRVPDDIGGRYSVLTAVGLLPIAVAGIDIDEMMGGAAKAEKELYECRDCSTNPCLKYVALRNILFNNEKSIEIYACYDPALTLMGEWWKQLFGESEGKKRRGLFPASVTFSTDLHSLGQIIQQGRCTMFETVVSVRAPKSDITITKKPEYSDGMDYLAGKTMSFINNAAMLATAVSHTEGKVPNILLEISDYSAESFGYLVYFFELACALSGYILGVNPFDQPGVEGYKNNMYGLLGKPDSAERNNTEIRLKLERELKEEKFNIDGKVTNLYNYFLGGD